MAMFWQQLIRRTVELSGVTCFVIPARRTAPFPSRTMIWFAPKSKLCARITSRI